MKDDQERMVDGAFLMIQAAISRVGETVDIDGALDEIRHAVNQIEPQLLLAAKRLTTQAIGEVMAGFSERSHRAAGDQPGNSADQTFLAMVVLGEIGRRAGQDGLSVLEWCRRERIKSLWKD